MLHYSSVNPVCGTAVRVLKLEPSNTFPFSKNHRGFRQQPPRSRRRKKTRRTLARLLPTESPAESGERFTFLMLVLSSFMRLQATGTNRSACSGWALATSRMNDTTKFRGLTLKSAFKSGGGGRGGGAIDGGENGGWTHETVTSDRYPQHKT